MVTRSQPDYAWDFCGGDLAIDFTNTVGSRGAEPEEHFNVYGDALSWAETRRVLTRADAQRLATAADRSPAGARQALAALIGAREALYRVVLATASGRRRPARDLATLNAHLAAAYQHARLESGGNRLALAFDPPGAGSLSEPILAPIVRAAADLLTSDRIARVRRCADQSCAWLFLDTTRSGTRRWCDMQVCGNRNKVRNFRTRA